MAGLLKEYLSIEAQVELLERRGMHCDDKTAGILAREGYYAVINGYGKLFLDEEATRRAGEDRFCDGTTFEQVHDVFRFDRELRMLTFSQLIRIEGMLRALAAAAFLETHDGPEDYLREACYSTPRHYLLGEENHESNLRHTINTLSRYAHDSLREAQDRNDVRIAHYRDNYDAVPLWVVFSDLSYGNLYHFIALMKMSEQEALCARLARVLDMGATIGALDAPGAANTESGLPTSHGQGDPAGAEAAPVQPTPAKAEAEGRDRRKHTVISRKTLVEDVGLQLEVRNICAHGERLYDARLGTNDNLRYRHFARMLMRYLTDEEYASYRALLLRIAKHYRGSSPVLDRELQRTCG